MKGKKAANGKTKVSPEKAELTKILKGIFDEALAVRNDMQKVMGLAVAVEPKDTVKDATHKLISLTGRIPGKIKQFESFVGSLRNLREFLDRQG